VLREPFQPDDIIKSCCNLESGLNLAVNGLRACTRGALMAPLFCSIKEINQGKVTKELIIERRKEYIRMLNDDHSVMDCKRCLMVVRKRYGDIIFSRLGHVDLQHYSYCNLRCTYCAYTQKDLHLRPQYNALSVLQCFSPENIEWNAHVDFAGGEPTLLENLDEYLEFFRNRRIRVLMFTNAVKFHQAIYNGLEDGSIYIATTSVDAGTPSTYKSLRGRDSYLRVLENLSRYAAAGSKGKGMLAVKYIFCENNCSDDDVAGFAYAMLALRPQQVWLTFDFSPMFLAKKDYDYSKGIEAYAKLYLLLKKHGIEAFHYFKEAIATVSQQGRDIMDRVVAAIERQSSEITQSVPDLIFNNYRVEEAKTRRDPEKCSINPLALATRTGLSEKLSLEGKRVLLVPACPFTKKLLSDPEIQKAEWIGFVDRNPIQQGKTIEGRMIYGYEMISSLNADVIMIAAPEKHRLDILNSINCNASSASQVVEVTF
jgi:wyosine [tRNA(Phe)-imidazoG37] synthetase (radical SAM superfamily)